MLPISPTRLSAGTDSPNGDIRILEPPDRPCSEVQTPPRCVVRRTNIGGGQPDENSSSPEHGNVRAPTSRLSALLAMNDFTGVWKRNATISDRQRDVDAAKEVDSTQQFPSEISFGKLDPEDAFPDGGREAWTVTFAAFLIIFATFGLENSIGTLQDYWQHHQLAAYSPSQVGWIPSVFVFLSLALGIVVGPVVDRCGPRYILLAGSIAYEVAILLLAECQTFWQFILCSGFVAGSASALLTTTSMTIVAHWFNSRRGFAQGIAMSGAAVGGVAISLILRATLSSSLGYKWSIRILACLFLVCLTGGNLLMKPRLSKIPETEIMTTRSLTLCCDARFILLAITAFGLEVISFGFVTILPTYVAYATKFPPDTGFYLIAITNATALFGRIMAGYVADKIGRFNVFTLMILFTLLTMSTIWLPFGQSSLPALYVATGLFGFGTGSWSTMTVASLGQLCRADEFGQYYGTLSFVSGISTLVCLPLSGELLTAIGARGLISVDCGILGLSITALIISRWACLEWKWSWTAKV